MMKQVTEWRRCQLQALTKIFGCKHLAGRCHNAALMASH
jgi:hypothetical protein